MLARSLLVFVAVCLSFQPSLFADAFVLQTFNGNAAVTCYRAQSTRTQPWVCVAENNAAFAVRDTQQTFLQRIFPGLTSKKQDRRREVKARLKNAVGLTQGKRNRHLVESILEELVEFSQENRTPNITGAWRLIWSSQTAEANPFAKPYSVLGGDCFQVVSAIERGEGRVENIVRWPQLGGLTLRGGASLKAITPKSVMITIDSFTLEGIGLSLPLLDLTKSRVAEIVVRDAPRVKQGSQLVTVAVDGERKLNKREGMLEVLYADEEGLRVSRGDNGLLYLYVKEDSWQ